MPKKNDTLQIITYDYDIYEDKKMEQVLGAIMSANLNQALPHQRPAFQYSTRRWGEKPIQDGMGFVYVHNTLPPDKWDYFGRRIIRQAIKAAYTGAWQPNKTVAEKIAEVKYYIFLVSVSAFVLSVVFAFLLPQAPSEPDIPPQPTYQGVPDEIPADATVTPAALSAHPSLAVEAATAFDVALPEGANTEPYAWMDDAASAPAQTPHHPPDTPRARLDAQGATQTSLSDIQVSVQGRTAARRR